MRSMLRLHDGFLFEGTPSKNHQMTIHKLGNGHAEATIRREIHWQELRRATVDELELWARDREGREEERREANRERAARRAKTRVRRLCKAAGLDTLLTLTYRANQTDLALCKKHLKEFVRRMRRLIPGWQYVGFFEPQERGAWHVHMAIHKLPMNLPAKNGVKVKSYNIVRAVWRSVTGELEGTINEARRKRLQHRSPAKIASYISKYCLKAFADGEDYSNRYSGGTGGKLPEPQRLRFVAESMADLVELAYGEIAMHRCEINTVLGWGGETFFLSTGPLPARLPWQLT